MGALALSHLDSLGLRAQTAIMKYLYIIFVSLLSIVALVWVIQLGIQGKPLAKIKLSEFASVEGVSDSILMRLRQELKDHNIVFLGVDPEEPEHMEIWRHLLLAAKEPGWKFDEIIVERGLQPKDPWGLQERVVDFKKEEEGLKSLWNSEAYKTKRIAVVVPHIYSSQLIKDNPIQRLKSNPEDVRFLSITAVPLAKSDKEPEIVRLPCAGEGADFTGESPLGCAIRNKSVFWKKPPKEKARLGVVEQYGLNDFIL
jgi:hypothetical protein